ncbi:MAG: hypothetical protein K0S45_2998, partial [Nitrospira sp.]|nr:hypothetical protein [Nitrospira sp.]
AYCLLMHLDLILNVRAIEIISRQLLRELGLQVHPICQLPAFFLHAIVLVNEASSIAADF